MHPANQAAERLAHQLIRSPTQTCEGRCYLELPALSLLLCARMRSYRIYSSFLRQAEQLIDDRDAISIRRFRAARHQRSLIGGNSRGPVRGSML